MKAARKNITAPPGRCEGAFPRFARRTLLFAAAFFLLFPRYPALAEAIPRLTAPPLGERWFILSKNDEKSGFVRQEIVQTDDGFRIVVESSVAMEDMAFSRVAASWETYLVNRDLSLKSFEAAECVKGSSTKVKGEVTARGLRVTVAAGGGTKEKTLKAKGAIYPSAALNFYPLMQGAVPGKSFRVKTLDVEDVKLTEVKISVQGVATLPGGPATVHLQNDLYPVVDNDIWVDLSGNTVRESVRDGWITTQAEDRKTVGRFIVGAAIAKRDLIIDFSLIRVPPVVRPRETRAMTVELSGIPREFPLPDGAGQKAEWVGEGTIRFSTVSRMSQNGDGRAQSYPTGIERYLAATAQLPSDKPAISALRQTILGDEKDPALLVGKLAGWTATNIKENAAESPSPLAILDSRSGDCLSIARLYASLARSAGIPTRVVAGIVYTEGKGFLYHSWAESYLGGWVTVDPTFGSVPADAAHIRLIEGDAPENLLPLAMLVGRVAAQVLEVKYGDQEPGTRDQEKPQPITGP